MIRGLQSESASSVLIMLHWLQTRRNAWCPWSSMLTGRRTFSLPQTSRRKAWTFPTFSTSSTTTCRKTLRTTVRYVLHRVLACSEIYVTVFVPTYPLFTLPLKILSVRSNGHFPAEPGLAGVYWSKGWWRWWWQLDYCSYKSCKAPVKSSSPTNHHPVFLQSGCPSCRSTNNVKALKGNSTRNSFVIKILQSRDIRKITCAHSMLKTHLSTNLFHQSASSHWTAFSDYTGPDLFC